MFFYDKPIPGSVFGEGGMMAPVINTSAGNPQAAALACTACHPELRWPRFFPSPHE